MFQVHLVPAGTNDLNDIVSLLAPTSYKFNELGRGLNLEAGVMGTIVYEARHSSPYDALVEVVTEWLKWSYPYQTFGKPSLSLLVKAVDTYDPRLAAKVFEKFTSAAGSAVGEHHFVWASRTQSNEYIISGHWYLFTA